MTIGPDSILIKNIKEKFGQSILDTSIFRDEATHLIRKESLLEVCKFLKDNSELQFNFLSDIAGIDYFPQNPRFEVVYHLYSISQKHRVRLKIKTEDGETVPSVTPVWSGADWAEREAYDMFGIIFEGHPNLKRIYMPDEWEGFPLRKDYPLKGYKDRYNPYGEEKDKR
ncbi:MAG: NADH-quinone oxidoreductase subunit C [Deltaproteobacteria bacterium]|nr:NADH-quinone oxidoreductase subunit C [Deltaproteobacteria bacterium]